MIRRPTHVLAIETSCDDTCAAVVSGDGRILSNVISSQGIHDRYGGVVPEVAARQHLDLLGPVIDDALTRAAIGLDDVGLVAATQGPGLVGALLVGWSAAKAIAASRGLRLAPVDHLQGHVAATFLVGEETAAMDPPFVCLVASGGHTFLAKVTARHGYEVLGGTLDDAAGEAFDKGARLLGLPYPGGPALERLAAGGDPEAFAFPIGRGVAGIDSSFSGVKTALLYAVRDLGEAEAARRAPDLAAAYQHAIVEALAVRCERALRITGLDRLTVGGGVAANGVLRARLQQIGVALAVPSRALCTDNAAMIAAAALHGPQLACPDYLALETYATGARGA